MSTCISIKDSHHSILELELSRDNHPIGLFRQIRHTVFPVFLFAAQVWPILTAPHFTLLHNASQHHHQRRVLLPDHLVCVRCCDECEVCEVWGRKTTLGHPHRTVECEFLKMYLQNCIYTCTYMYRGSGYQF